MVNSKMKNIFRNRVMIASGALVLVAAVAGVVYANNVWGSYHWARTANPFTLKLGDNVSTEWDAYLAEASLDWSLSSVLNTTVVLGGTSPKTCKAKSGRVEVCSARYGFNGWLGVASVSVSGDHILAGTVKLNDTYLKTATYNTPAWRRLVMCQEVGHTLGLDHQDEDPNNPNLGTCMDYTRDPDGPLSNEHPNAHDYQQLEIIYSHLDSVTTVGQAVLQSRQNLGLGKGVRQDSEGRTSRFVKDLGKGHKVFTFILWAD